MSQSHVKPCPGCATAFKPSTAFTPLHTCGMRQREVDAFTAKVYAGAGLPVKPMSDLEAAIIRLRGARPVHAPFTLEDWQALAVVLDALDEETTGHDASEQRNADMVAELAAMTQRCLAAEAKAQRYEAAHVTPREAEK